MAGSDNSNTLKSSRATPVLYVNYVDSKNTFIASWPLPAAFPPTLIFWLRNMSAPPYPWILTLPLNRSLWYYRLCIIFWISSSNQYFFHTSVFAISLVSSNWVGNLISAILTPGYYNYKYTLALFIIIVVWSGCDHSSRFLKIPYHISERNYALGRTMKTSTWSSTFC